MTEGRESAPVRAVGFGLLAFVFGWLCLAVHQSGAINLAFRSNRTPVSFQLSRALDGWQFEFVVALLGALALSSVLAASLAVLTLLKPERDL